MRYRFIFVPAIFLASAAKVFAHVGYVVDSATLEREAGLDVDFLTTVLADPFSIGLMVLTAVIVLFLVVWNERSRILMRFWGGIGKKLESYADLIPWMIRLSLGIALIGAGSAGALISPVAGDMSQIAFIEVLIGFMLLAGFLVPLASVATLFLFLKGIDATWYLFGNLDFFALGLVLLILSNSRPGVDDLLGLRLMPPLKKFSFAVPLILRIGIATGIVDFFVDIGALLIVWLIKISKHHHHALRC